MKEDIRKFCVMDKEEELHKKPRTRRMLRRKLQKIEVQLKKLIMDVAALTPYGPQVKQISIVLDELEQDLTAMYTNGFLD